MIQKSGFSQPILNGSTGTNIIEGRTIFVAKSTESGIRYFSRGDNDSNFEEMSFTELKERAVSSVAVYVGNAYDLGSVLNETTEHNVKIGGVVFDAGEKSFNVANLKAKLKTIPEDIEILNESLVLGDLVGGELDLTRFKKLETLKLGNIGGGVNIKLPDGVTGFICGNVESGTLLQLPRHIKCFECNNIYGKVNLGLCVELESIISGHIAEGGLMKPLHLCF